MTPLADTARMMLKRQADKVCADAGATNWTSLYTLIISRGWRKGDDLTAFRRLEGIFHHVAQPLVWAAETDTLEDAARWERHAYRGAFMLWLEGRA